MLKQQKAWTNMGVCGTCASSESWLFFLLAQATGPVVKPLGLRQGPAASWACLGMPVLAPLDWGVKCFLFQCSHSLNISAWITFIFETWFSSHFH